MLCLRLAPIDQAVQTTFCTPKRRIVGGGRGIDICYFLLGFLPERPHHRPRNRAHPGGFLFLSLCSSPVPQSRPWRATSLVRLYMAKCAHETSWAVALALAGQPMPILSCCYCYAIAIAIPCNLGEYVSTPGKLFAYFPPVLALFPQFLSPCWGPVVV